MARGRSYTMAELEVRAALGGQPGVDARLAARALAARSGIEVPAWAAKKPFTRASKPSATVVRREPPPSVSADVAAVTVPIAPELSAFMRAHPGTILQIRAPETVVIHLWGAEPLRFDSMALAVASVA